MGYNPNTGEMEPIDAALVEEFRKAMPIRTLQEEEARMLEALREKGHDYTMLLREGEEVEIKGGRFRVVSIGRRHIGLEGLPQK